MKLPEIGQTVTTDDALKLCRHFGLAYLVERIESEPELYQNWPFDGCSGLPDELMGLFSGCRWEHITYKCCLPHDLGYGYGEPGNRAERRGVDLKFYRDLVTEAGMKAWAASAFLAVVRVAGAERWGLSFSWGFARKQRC